jgi:glutamate formiminotransferase
MNQLLECVPNFSEGRNTTTINTIAAAIASVEGVALLHVDVSPAANRTVMTFAGAPQQVVLAAFNAIKVAAELIDMSQQDGVHPRIGATDVCPLVPLREMTMEEAVACSKSLGKMVGENLQVPVYLYEYSADKDYRRSLPVIRKGQYEGLSDKMQQPEWYPDFGSQTFNPKYGATVIGARDILVAFNISLHTDDVQKAHWIAQRLRESGYTQTIDGHKYKVAGALPKLRAIGWYMADYQQAQVSLNLLDYRITSPLKAWNECARLGAEIGVTLAGSELIGLMPEACLLEAGIFAQQQKGLMHNNQEELIAAAIEYLGLNKLKPFDPNEKILEYKLKSVGY